MSPEQTNVSPWSKAEYRMISYRVRMFTPLISPWLSCVNSPRFSMSSDPGSR